MVSFTLNISKQVLTSIRIASTVHRTFIYKIYIYIVHIILYIHVFCRIFCDRCGQSTVATGDAVVELTILNLTFS